MKVVVGASSFAESSSEALQMMLERKIEVVKNPYGRKMTEEEIIEQLQGADGLLAGLEPLNETVFQNCSNLKAIARIGIGMDNVDQEAASRYGIRISNTPEGPTDAVAEMVLAVLLSISHNVIASNRDIHNGIWKKRIGKSIAELTVLVVGYGRIGKRTAELLSGFGTKILIYDKYDSSASTCSLVDGLRRADVVTMHASGNDIILTEEMFSNMKEGMILLNSARGGLIHEQALYNALQSGKVAAFWGDALWSEPYHGIICGCENAVLTPHICTYTSDCRKNMEMQAVLNLLQDLEETGVC